MQTLINGEITEFISVSDRGLQYGDGCFETVLLSQGLPVLIDLHLQRLRLSLERLKIDVDDVALQQELQRAIENNPAEGILKITVTRGEGGRGYRPDSRNSATRIIQYFPYPGVYRQHGSQGVCITVCKHRLSNSNHGGMKHLNRLDQVMASQELTESFAEGLCLDQADKVIEATRSNLLLVVDGKLTSPDLGSAGVNGVMLQYLGGRFSEAGDPVQFRELALAELATAEELFLCNSVFGVWPVIKLVENDTVLNWSVGPRTQRAIHYQNEVFIPASTPSR